MTAIVTVAMQILLVATLAGTGWAVITGKGYGGSDA